MIQDLSKSYNLSFWEVEQLFEKIDLLVVGSGIVGLTAAIHYKLKNRNAKILVIERGILPYGASTKNAGFACYGSVSEIVSDFKNFGEKVAFETIQQRIEGLKLLFQIVSKKQIQYDKCGGFELFTKDENYNEMFLYIDRLNAFFATFFEGKSVWKSVNDKVNEFGFAGVKGMIVNTHEGSINTGLLMNELIKICNKNDIHILNNITVNEFTEINNSVNVKVNEGLEIFPKKMILATNGFAKKLFPQLEISPARAQVLITKPLKNIFFKGTFHFDEGFYYFRNYGNRVLLGGARNLDIEGEKTMEFGITNAIQSNLENYLTHMILPNQSFEIEHRWSGIMGLGKTKKPIVEQISKNIFCAVKMGGMGIAIGSSAGKKVAELVLES